MHFIRYLCYRSCYCLLCFLLIPHVVRFIFLPSRLIAFLHCIFLGFHHLLNLINLPLRLLTSRKVSSQMFFPTPLCPLSLSLGCCALTTLALPQAILHDSTLNSRFTPSFSPQPGRSVQAYFSLSSLSPNDITIVH